ncbi:FtsX-like permease family protein [Actinacidiphila rubida]|uniref:FtsX-like permease family protein n=1 Tax=Actinacidiphila rubida TaxID=310780 RepID=UPI001FE51CDD|nr:FtsX-like permease family protein [Actinacidiphila rubida]
MTRTPATGAAMTLRLIRREIRGDLPLLACLAVLVATLTALCAWAPAAAGRQEDRALKQRIAAAQAQAPVVTLSATPEVLASDPPRLDMARLLGDGRALHDRLGGPAARHLTFAPGGGYDYSPASVTAPRPPDGTVSSTELTLSHLPDAQGRLRYVGGHAPAEHTPVGTPPQIALSQSTARALGVGAGRRLDVGFTPTPGVQQAPPRAVLQVSGVFVPTPGADGFWSGQSTLVQPSRHPAARATGTVLVARGLVGTDAADLLARAGVSGPLVTWQLRADLGPRAVDQARALSGALSQYGPDLNVALCQGVDQITGDISCHVGRQATGSLRVIDALTPLLDDFAAQDDQARALAWFAVDSLAAVVLATTAVAVRLLLRRREDHLRLQRARGASTARLVLLRSAVAWPVVAAAGLLGYAAGRYAAPTGSSGTPQPLIALAAACAVALTVSLMTWVAVRERSRPRRRGRPRRIRVGGRRLVMECTVLVAGAAGVAALRSQGPDPVLGAVPALLAVVAVLVLLRLHPPVLGLVRRWTGRRRGTAGFVGVARAAHDAPATGMALFVMVLTLGTAVFGGLVQRTVDLGLSGGAAWSVGADAGATTEGNTVPAPGVLTGTAGIRMAVQNLHNLTLVGQADGAVISPVAVVTVDPRQLAAVAPESPLAGVLRSALAGAPPSRPSGGAPLPAVVSAGLRAQERTGGFTATVQADGQPRAHLTLEPRGTLTAAELRDPLLGPLSARIPAGTPLLITTASAEYLMAQQSSGSTVLLLHDEGSAAGEAALRSAAARVLGPQARFRDRSATLNTLRHDGLTRGLVTVYATSSALAALAGLLAVALELILTAHERRRTTSFLRALGLGGREARAMHVLQLLPLAVASAVGGTALGLLEPRLMEQALDLRQFTGGPAQPALRADGSLTVALVASVVALVLTAAVTETALARRRRPAEDLRPG